jgi:hypothetical protein
MRYLDILINATRHSTHSPLFPRIEVGRVDHGAVPEPDADPAPIRRESPVVYRSIRFYGPSLHFPLAEAAEYLRRLELETGKPPHVLCVHDEFSAEDEGSDLAWGVTLVVSEPPADLTPDGDA